MRPNKDNLNKFYGLEHNETYSFISTNPGQPTPFDAKFIRSSPHSILLEIDNKKIDYPNESINVQEGIPRARLVDDGNPHNIEIVIAKKIGGSLKKRSLKRRRSLKRKRVRNNF